MKKIVDTRPKPDYFCPDMKYFIKNNGCELIVQMNGASEEEQLRVCTLAENMFESKVINSYYGLTLYLESKKQFNRLIKWKSMFDGLDVNKPFNFINEARKSLKISKEILNKDVVEISEECYSY